MLTRRMRVHHSKMERDRRHRPLSHIVEDEELNSALNALFAAAEEGSLAGLKQLLDGRDGTNGTLSINHPNKHGETIFHLAASGGHLEVIQYLQTKDVDLKATDKLGDTAIHWAARQGQLEVIKYLKTQELSIDAQNKNGETPLHVATRYGHLEILEYLCHEEADVSLQDKHGETVLHNAAWYGLPAAVCEIMCAVLKDVNVKNKDDETPLHIASSRGHLGCAKVLVHHGADINMPDKRGARPLHLACRRRQTPVSVMLLQAGCDMDVADQLDETALHPASKEGLLPIVQTLCAYGCIVDVVNKAGVTPLHLAARAGHVEVVRCLLLSGAEPDCPNKEGITAEIMALSQGHNDIAELLVKLKPERREQCISQLMPTDQPLPRIKVKMFGSAQVGKSTLIDSLKCGYFGSFFRKARLSNASSVTSLGKESENNSSPRHRSLPTQLTYDAAHAGYTRGIDVQQANISSDLSIWEFSGYEPYFMTYDHFIGDPNCVHMILFNLEDSQDVQLAQVLFWLNFIKARIAPMEPIGSGGRQPWPAKVCLVATHADKVNCAKNDNGEFVSDDAEVLLATILQKFQADVDITKHVFVVDAHLAMATDMKALRIHLGVLKSEVVQRLPRSNGFLEATISALPPWRKVLASLPVVPWTSFIDYVRAKVNLLASEGHMKELMCALQLVGEVFYVENETEHDLVVLDPKWLSTNVIGHLLSHENILHSRPTGCFTAEDIQLMFGEIEVVELLQLLEALELCTRCDVDGDVEYEFPCLNFVETLHGLWEPNDSRVPNAVYGGLRMQSPRAMTNQLLHLFPRIQVQLRRDNLRDENNPDTDLYQWYHGSKLCAGHLESLVTLEKNEQVLEIKCRGPEDSRGQLYTFLQDVCDVVEGVLDDSCPGIALEKHVLSAVQLKQHVTPTFSYSPKDVLTAELDGEKSVRLDGDKSELLADLLYFGDDETGKQVTLGVDLHVSHLSLHARRKLASLLDPPDPMGKDWVMLAVSLGLTPDLPKLDSEWDPVLSRTDWSLATWSQGQKSTIGMLLTRLRGLGRPDALDSVLTCAPLCEIFLEENGEKPEPPSDNSDNTLSSTLSR